ncbi:unnamed protein product, partial [Effrenium voratum]
ALRGEVLWRLHSKAQGELWQPAAKAQEGTLGLLQQDLAEPLRSSGRRGKVPDQWMPPLDASTGGLERSELGLEATSEVRRWLLGQTSGQQCSQVILDRALTVLSNFKLASWWVRFGGPRRTVRTCFSQSQRFWVEFEKKRRLFAVFLMHGAGHSRLAVLSLCTRPKEPEAPKSSRVVCSLAGALTAKLCRAMEDDFATLLLSLEACHFRQVHRLQAELRREVSRSASADADRHAAAACEGRNGVMGGEAAGDALQMKKELDPPWPNTPGHSPRAKSEKNDFFLKKSSTAFRWKGSKNKYLADMLKHPLCDCTMSFLIVVNAIIFAFEAQYKGFDLGNELGLRQEGAHLLWPGATEAFEVAELTFGIIFSLEVVLRLWVERLKFFCDGWNLLDFVVVLVWALGRAWQGLPVNSQILRLGRLFRLLRMLRLVRKIKEFDALFLMTTAIRSSFMVLGWTIMLLFLCQMLFALVVQQILFGFYFDPSNLEILDDQREVYMYFGTFSRALLSLFEMTLANWPPVCLFHKLTMGFAVVGVINGVLMQETFKVAHMDDTVMVREKQRAIRAHVQKMSLLFEEADTSGDGRVDLAEFKRILDDHEVKVWLAAMDVDVSDVDELFSMLDDGADGRLSAEELVAGISKLQGVAKAMDLRKVIRKHEEMNQSLACVMSRPATVTEKEDEDYVGF